MAQPTTVSRRAALGLILAGTGSILAACQTTAPAVSSTSQVSVSATRAPQAQAQPASVPKSGGTLRTALPSDITSLEGHLYFVWSFESTWLAFDRLTEYDAPGSNPSRCSPKAGMSPPTSSRSS